MHNDKNYHIQVYIKLGGIFVKKENISDNCEGNSCDEIYKKVKLVLWIILFANLGVAITKIVVGHLINSASLSADGIHSMSDGMSNIIGIIGIKLLIKFIKGKDIKSIIKLILSIGIPYIVIAILLMTYNYVRFKNVLEFGSSYQLTVNSNTFLNLT